MADKPRTRQRSPRNAVPVANAAEAAAESVGTGHRDGADRQGDARPAGETVAPALTWLEVAAKVDALALAERHTRVPRRITYPGNAPETHHGPFYGAAVVKGDVVRVLMSDGTTIKL